VYIEIN